MTAVLRYVLRGLGHLTWLRFGVRDRVIRYFHHPDTCAAESFRVDFFGASYEGNFNTFLDWNVYYYGAYAREELRLIEDFLATRTNAVLMDVGANIGHHTLFAARHAQQVLAFEPFELVSNKLVSKVRDNGLSNVKLFAFALGDKNEMLEYGKPTSHNTGTGSFMNGARGQEATLLPIRIGDDALEERGITQVDFIKIDTEGFEPMVLRGLRNTLERCRPIVFFEWTQIQRTGAVAAESQLFPTGYRFFEFVSDTVKLAFFRQLSYRLVPLDSGASWPDGNLLAIDGKEVSRLAMSNPRSNAARQLNRLT